MNLDSAEQLFLCVVSQLDGFCEYCLKYNTFFKCLGKYFYQKISQWITWQNLQPTMSKQGDCFSGWRLTFSSSSVELLLVGKENLPRHVVHSTSVTGKGLFLAAEDYLFSCRECHIAYSKWKSYCLYLLAAWQARVPHNLGWEEEGSSSSLARKTEKNSQDSPASVGMLKECLCSGLMPVFPGVTSLTFFPVTAVPLPVHGHKEKEKISVYCLGCGSWVDNIWGVAGKMWAPSEALGWSFIWTVNYSLQILHPTVSYDILGSISRQMNK